MLLFFRRHTHTGTLMLTRNQARNRTRNCSTY